MIPITDIETQVARVLEHSQNTYGAQTQAMLDKWYDAKHYFIEAWGGCIYEVEEPVTFYLSNEEKRNRLNEFIDTIDSCYGNRDLAGFLDCVSIEEIFNNHTTKVYHSPEGEMPVGTKISRAFKYFEKNDYVLRKLQDQLSMIIQEDRITGTLCLSVHPLDFLSSSENTYHWRSCHSLDGDYRSGNLSYMMDSSTIVCYLRGAEDQKLPNFPDSVLWNSKKWRMLLFTADRRNALFAGRQYPFFSPSALDIVQEHYLHSVNARVSSWTPWYNDFMKRFPREQTKAQGMFEPDHTWLDGRYICMNGAILETRRIIQEPKHALFFNDLTESSCYIPYYSWNSYTGQDIHFTIGAEVPCPFCDGAHFLTHAEEMYCEHCYSKCHSSNYTYCERCDRRVRTEDSYYLQTAGITLCEECYEESTIYCSNCNEPWPEYSMHYNRETGEYTCPICRRHGQDDEEWLTLPF